MDDLTQKIAALRDELRPAWDEAHCDRLLAGIGRLKRRRRPTPVLTGGALLIGFVVAVVLASRNLAAIQEAGAFVVRTGGAAYRNLTELPQFESAGRLQLGAADDPRSKAASIVVTQVHAQQRVRLADGPSALVSSATRALDVAPTVRELSAEPADDPAALIVAADAARVSNHPKAAVEHLRRVLRDHAKSPVAPLAGFTLGRVLLESLGQPSEAAEAFALARSLAPQGSLAQDALAREVESWSKAGRAREAYERAQLYVQLYPAGQRRRAVRLLGGLE